MRAVCLVLVLGFVSACSGDDGGNSGCGGKVTDVSPGVAPGMLTIMGDFADGQPILRYTKNGGTTSVPAGQYTNTSASFTGLPSGMLTVDWVLSCFDDSGQSTIAGPGTVTVP